MAISVEFGGFRRVLGSSTSNLAVYSSGQKRFELGNLSLSNEGASTAAALVGLGTSTTPISLGTTANKNLIGFWATSAATSGDTRLLYLRQYFTSTGSGEAARLYASVTGASGATGGTINGAHISCSISGSGTISGQANALRATLDVAQDLTPGGTLAAISAEFVAGTGVTLPSVKGLIRLIDSDNTSIKNGFVFPTVASGGMFAAHTTQTLTHSLRVIDAAGSVFYVMCTNAATNRTGGA